MNLEALKFELRDNIAWITFDRPASYNAMNRKTMTELSEVANYCATEPSVRAAVLTGAGEKAFCAGGDVTAFHSGLDRIAHSVYEGTIVPLHRRAASRFAWMRAPLIAGL